MNDGSKKSRRRRSSSLLYQEPQESMEHLSDQSAIPNLNANWVNAKGMLAKSFPAQTLEQPNQQGTWADHCFGYRCLGDPYRPHRRSQNFLQHYPGHPTRHLLVPHQHHVHVRVLPDVPLGPRHPFRVQCRSIRQPQHVGTDG